MKKKVTLIVVAVLLIISLVVGMSYAYWRLTYKGTLVNKIVSSCFSMELTNEKNNITLDSAYPISDEKGKSLTPYSFTITNTCDLFASYTINLEMLEGTTLNSKYIKTMINNEAITNLNTLETTDASIEAATESRVLFKGSLGSGDSVDYTLRLWMDSDTPFNEDSMNKIFQTKITVTGEVSTYSPVENGFTNLADALLVNEYQTTSLDIAKDRIATKQSVDFSKTAPIIVWESEKSSNQTTVKSKKANPTAIGSDGVVEKTTQIVYGLSYEFNSETGYYILKDTAYYNPTDVDYSEGDYYYCGSSITGTSAGKVMYNNGTSCITMYKLVDMFDIEEGTITLNNGNVVDTLTYSFKAYEYTQFELESDKSDKGLYSTIDADGLTYYYRGSVSNNYVKFANFYWKIVRINGDGSIKLLYSGTTSDAVGSAQSILKNKYHTDSKNATYVGYMYSNTVDTSYDDTIKNDNDSYIKLRLDNWYITNILDKGYSNYLVDNGFCNDRTFAVDNTGNGYNFTTFYASRYRILNNTPSLFCTNPSNDLFTLSGNVKGNGKLTYPIGLIAVDELYYAGVLNGSLNKLSYIHSDLSYWTMSPVYYNHTVTAAYVWSYSNVGSLDPASYVTLNYGIRPVINLKADTEITGGIGTKNDPFIVK